MYYQALEFHVSQLFEVWGFGETVCVTKQLVTQTTLDPSAIASFTTPLAVL